MNIAEVIGWKFNHQPGMRCAEVNGVLEIIEFPGGVPSKAEQTSWASEYVAHLAKPTKLSGVEFDGIMCSATAEDMWGLTSVKAWVTSGNDVDFKFSNGNVLALTPANIADFESVWTPFRASFF